MLIPSIVWRHCSALSYHPKILSVVGHAVVFLPTSTHILRRHIMVSTETSNLLGVGLYSPAEAALYARVSSQTMSRWVFGSGQSESAIKAQLGSAEKVVTFLDFVQALAIRSIRLFRETPIPLQKIRSAVQFAETEFGITYPLARKHKIFLMNDELIINVGDRESDKYVLATGKHKRNFLLNEIAECFLEDVGFDGSGLASWYRPFMHHEYEVKMDPHLRFGEPLIPSCGYSAQALWDAYRFEGGIKAAAKAYGVKEGEVETAVLYFEQITPRQAA